MNDYEEPTMEILPYKNFIKSGGYDVHSEDETGWGPLH